MVAAKRNLTDILTKVQARNIPCSPRQISRKLLAGNGVVVSVEKLIEPFVGDQIGCKCPRARRVRGRNQILHERGLEFCTGQHHAWVPVKIGFAVKKLDVYAVD
ncbi:hypothetical protein D3C81_1994730 [compost metagenome]